MIVWLALLSLTGCDSSAPNTPTSVSNSTPVVTPAATASATTANVAPAQLTPGNATPTLVIQTAAVPTPATTTGPESDKVKQALQSLADSTSLTYTVQQQGDLKNSNSLTHFEAQGQGEWQHPAYHQLLTFTQGGTSEQLEAYGDGIHTYQRTVGLAIWKPASPVVTAPFPTNARLNGITNFQAAGSQTLNGTAVTGYGWQFPTSQLLPASGSPESLGVLSVTGLYQSFVTDNSMAQAKLWLNSAGQPVRYEVTATLTAGDSSLAYTATYDYSNFNGSVLVAAPTDLPK